MSISTRSHTCGELSKKDIGINVTLSGWVHRRRDHGGLIFIDLRDRFGLTQLVFRPTTNSHAHAIADMLRAEWVISIEGKVIPRENGMVNPKLKTGEIEIEVDKIEVHSRAKTPPFAISDDTTVANEEIRMKYRYLDLRRGDLAKRLEIRHQAMMAARKNLSELGFLEITTPVLGKSTPEGARDFLVPSRLHPGNFYALPQSPQLFKQLLMIGGMDRYFQIATCFRDEDSRADRQPEFTQIDIEISFANPDIFFPIVEKLIKDIFEFCIGAPIQLPIPRMTHAEAMEFYGTDKPDLRFDMKLHRLDDIIKDSQFSIFLEALKMGHSIKGLCVKGGADLSRRQIEEYTSFVEKFGAKGLAWIKIESEGPSSSIVKFFPAACLERLCQTFGAETKDLILMIAEEERVVNQSLDHLRRKIARDRHLINPDVYKLTWVTEFPLFQWDRETQSYECEHHPFTSPHLEDLAFLESDPLKIRSSSYDLVLNGYELGSGSQRIHSSELQAKIFKLLKISDDEIAARFGFFIEALNYGTPPHMGIALGLDRIVMILTQTESLKDVIAFPKTQQFYDLMLDAPSAVLQHQLQELKIHVDNEPN